MKKLNVKEIVITLAVIILLCVSVFTFSTAYFMSTVQDDLSENEQGVKNSITKVRTGVVNSAMLNGDTFYATRTLPGWSQTKEFSITNNSDETIYYKYQWKTLDYGKITDMYYSYVGESSDDSNPAVSSKDNIPFVTDSSRLSVGSDLFDVVSLAPGVTHTYKITLNFMNLDKDQSEQSGNSLKATIAIVYVESGD